jgi:hypothetical protein
MLSASVDAAQQRSAQLRRPQLPRQAEPEPESDEEREQFHQDRAVERVAAPARVADPPMRREELRYMPVLHA